MSYAVRNDGLGWWAVNSPDDVGPDEHYSEDQPPEVIAADTVVDPETKLQKFLDSNPDVAALLK
jgi:hypothetical protein